MINSKKSSKQFTKELWRPGLLCMPMAKALLQALMVLMLFRCQAQQRTQ
jgi:hypothetical protein